MIPVMGYNTINEIPLQILLPEVLERKKAGMRLSQACASYLDGKFELSYSFADDENLNYETLRVLAGLNEPVPTISDMYPYAAFYENEMKELFGVNIHLIDPDYHDKFYRIKAQTPFLPEDAQKKKAEELLKAAGAVKPETDEEAKAAGKDAKDKAAKTAAGKAAKDEAVKTAGKAAKDEAAKAAGKVAKAADESGEAK